MTADRGGLGPALCSSCHHFQHFRLLDWPSCYNNSFTSAEREGLATKAAAIWDLAIVGSTKRATLTFRYPFSLKGIDRPFAAGQYELITNEEPIEELLFPIYRRVATLIFLSADASQPSSIKIVDVDTRPFRKS